MKRKVILTILVLLTLTVALGYSYEFFRLAIIRSTINLPLPGWLQNIIWGWK